MYFDIVNQMLISSFYLLTLFNYVVSQGYLVSLKNSKTMEHFRETDLQYPEDQRALPFIERLFKIGNFLAFSGQFPLLVLQRLKKCPVVAEITPDLQVQAFEIMGQKGAPRHLAKLSHVKLEESDFSYYYDDEANGDGVKAYVIDSGVNIEHPELEGRAIRGTNLVSEESGDQNGHGTHVAGIIGSRTYGVAKGATIVEVKALDKFGAGSLSNILASLEFVALDQKNDSLSVVNLSLGAMRNSVLNDAISALVDMEVLVVAAAGNSNINACNMSPASCRDAITVGAINDTSGTMAEFSNWGPCVDIFASGTNVQSLSASDFTVSQTLSGSSMAAPIITGLIANLLSEGVETSEIKDRLLSDSLHNGMPRRSLFFKGRTPNRIAMGIQMQD